MIGIKKAELISVDLPFREVFRHSAASRTSSCSVFLQLVTTTGVIGFGETLPRSYVTGETRESVVSVLSEDILPHLMEMQFFSLQDVIDFLGECDGSPPHEWTSAPGPLTATWCAVDIALLDALSKAFGEKINLGSDGPFPREICYSPVLSGYNLKKLRSSLIKIRQYGCKQVKLKIGTDDDEAVCRTARKILGKKCDIRADVNMGWTVEEAVEKIHVLEQYGIVSFEQPIDSNDIEGFAYLVKTVKPLIMIDEGLHDRISLQALIEKKACTAVNIRIAKCGGLVAAYNRCRDALQAGLTVQIGCQTGESSLLSSAHIKLVKEVRDIAYAESCFGLYLLEEDPGMPVLQFGYGGRPPKISHELGFGIEMNKKILKRWTTEEREIKQKIESGGR